MREQVKGDLMRILLGPRLAARKDGAGLLLEFDHRGGSRAGDGLIRRGDDAADRACPPEGVEREDDGRRGAVGNGENAAMRVNVVGVDLRDDEGHVRLHAPYAAVVHDDAAALFRGEPHLAAHGVVGGYESEVAVVENGGGGLL